MPLKRGAPFGNKNRLTHGRFTAEAVARRTRIRCVLRAARTAMAEAKLILRERRLLSGAAKKSSENHYIWCSHEQDDFRR